MTLRLLCVASLVVLLCGCHERSPQQATAPHHGEWAATMPVSFRPPAGPSTASAATMPVARERTLEQILGDVEVTAQQRTQANQIVSDAQRQWQAWLSGNISQQQSLLKEVEAAADAKDKEKLTSAQEKWAVAIKDMPRTRTTWQKLREGFTPEQQAKLEQEKDEVTRSLSGTLHRSVSEISAKNGNDAGRCKVCHLPHYKVN